MATQKIKNRTQFLSYIAIIAGFVVVLNIVASIFFVRLDLTDKKVYSISKASKKMLGKLDDMVTVKVMFSKKLPPNFQNIEDNVRDILAEYKAYGGRKINVSWEDPGATPEGKTKAQSLGVPEIQMQTYEKDNAQVITGFLGIVVIFEDKKEVLPVVQDMRNFEYDLTMAIMKVSRSEAPRVAMLKTDTLPSIPPQMRQQYNIPQNPGETEVKFKAALESIRKNYTVDVVDISEGTPIDNSYRTLIVPGGENFSDRDIFEIDQYFMNGGNLIVLADAVDIRFTYGAMGYTTNSKILPLLEHYGARVEPNMVLDASCGQVSIPQRIGNFQMNVPVQYPHFVHVIRDGFDRDNPAVSGLGEMMFPWPSSISLLVNNLPTGKTATGVTGQVLVRSSQKSWVTQDLSNLNPQQDWRPDPKSFKPQNLVISLNGDFTSYFAGKVVPPTRKAAMAANDPLNKIQLSAADQGRTPVESNTGRHLVVVGTSRLVADQNAMPSNLAFLLNVTDWLSLDNNLISIRSRTLDDRSIRKDMLSQNPVLTNIIRYVNIFGMSILLVAAGLFLYYKRTGAKATASSKEQGV